MLNYEIAVIIMLFSIPKEDIGSGRRIKTIDTVSEESLCFSAEKVIKEHQNERSRMKNLGKLVPIDGSEGDLEESSPMPVPLRRKGFNPSKTAHTNVLLKLL